MSVYGGRRFSPPRRSTGTRSILIPFSIRNMRTIRGFMPNESYKRICVLLSFGFFMIIVAARCTTGLGDPCAVPIHSMRPMISKVNSGREPFKEREPMLFDAIRTGSSPSRTSPPCGRTLGPQRERQNEFGARHTARKCNGVFLVILASGAIQTHGVTSELLRGFSLNGRCRSGAANGEESFPFPSRGCKEHAFNGCEESG